jgi:hypothetical protein
MAHKNLAKTIFPINKGYMTGCGITAYYYEAGTTAIAGQAQNGQNNNKRFNTQSIIQQTG